MTVKICFDAAHGKMIAASGMGGVKDSFFDGVYDSTKKCVEANITLAAATALKKKGEKKCVYFLTRLDDNMISPSTRLSDIKTFSPDIVITIHCSIAGDKNKTQTTSSGATIGYWADDDVSHNLALYIERGFKSRLPQYKIVLSDSDDLLLNNSMTSISISLGYVNNPNDQVYLGPKLLDLVTAITDGISAYLAKYPTLPKRSDKGKTIPLLRPDEVVKNELPPPTPEESSGNANTEATANQIDQEKVKAEIMTLLTKVQRETSDMEFIKRRFFYRTGTMVMPFNPNLVIGFPAEIEVMYSSGNLDTLLGQIVGLQHTIDVESGQAMTTVNFNMLRTKQENGDMVSRDSAFSTIKKEMDVSYLFLGLNKKERDMATIDDVKELFEQTEYAKKIVKNYFPKETAKTSVDNVSNKTKDGVYQYLGTNIDVSPPEKDKKILIDNKGNTKDTVQGGRNHSVLAFLTGVEIPVAPEGDIWFNEMVKGIDSKMVENEGSEIGELSRPYDDVGETLF